MGTSGKRRRRHARYDASSPANGSRQKRTFANRSLIPTLHQLWDAVVVSEDAVDQACEEYDRAEQAYITAIASGAAEPTLRGLAKRVAEAARSWELADNAADPPPSDITRYYDVPEVISTLWRDLADAHERRAR